MSMGQNKLYENALIFFRKPQLITVLICDSFMSFSTRLALLKVCVGFSTFDSVSFLLFYFCSTKSIDDLILKRYNSFQN